MSDLSPTGADLLAALEQRGPSPALIWYGGEDGRTELSGHVLANWVTKTVNLLRDELFTDPGAPMVIAMPPHWKRLVLALAGWSVGAEVRILSLDAAAGEAAGLLAEPLADGTVLATSDPALDAVDQADEVLVLDPVSLALRFSGEVPDLAHDYLPAVRGHGDHLSAPLEHFSGPSPAHLEGGDHRGDGSGSVEPGAVVALEDIDGADASRAFAVWLAGGVVLAPAWAVSEEQQRAEGVR
ncbi:TIGR03089 family protein [Helcobacillus massiliensis]|uniref:TIGR03089 family protein n=1 Tax=Helcobacillus massiliensis TaxID=521392 RepID=UPI002553AE76|nr:TIGR03089 family protein [Helcobacillus massiliensis]MDK7742243.1 TIGR03089 family protein [Helcobacillus massiliensis]WOO93496.1 TIGR03089 family protein [Helcobacillus massiliensis]